MSIPPRSQLSSSLGRGGSEKLSLELALSLIDFLIWVASPISPKSERPYIKSFLITEVVEYRFYLIFLSLSSTKESVLFLPKPVFDEKAFWMLYMNFLWSAFDSSISGSALEKSSSFLPVIPLMKSASNILLSLSECTSPSWPNLPLTSSLIGSRFSLTYLCHSSLSTIFVETALLTYLTILLRSSFSSSERSSPSMMMPPEDWSPDCAD